MQAIKNKGEKTMPDQDSNAQIVQRLKEKIEHHKQMLKSEFGCDFDRQMIDHLSYILTGEG
jgi:hypothetical protein